MDRIEDELPEWDSILSAASHLQRIFPDAVLVGGTAAAIHAQHRRSVDADHVLKNLADRFDSAVNDLESVAGWNTARIRRPVLVLGNLDGIETGVRQLIRKEPLETEVVDYRGFLINVPTLAEMIRIKGVLILKRNATRDYLDFAALVDRAGPKVTDIALLKFDELYRIEGMDSPVKQLVQQLANPVPYDLDEKLLKHYKNLVPRWQDWSEVKRVCNDVCVNVFVATPVKKVRRRGIR